MPTRYPHDLSTRQRVSVPSGVPVRARLWYNVHSFGKLRGRTSSPALGSRTRMVTVADSIVGPRVFAARGLFFITANQKGRRRSLCERPCGADVFRDQGSSFASHNLHDPSMPHFGGFRFERVYAIMLSLARNLSTGHRPQTVAIRSNDDVRRAFQFSPFAWYSPLLLF